MLQQDSPEDFVLATGETHPVREFVEKAFGALGMKIKYALSFNFMLMDSLGVQQMVWQGRRRARYR